MKLEHYLVAVCVEFEHLEVVVQDEPHYEPHVHVLVDMHAAHCVLPETFEGRFAIYYYLFVKRIQLFLEFLFYLDLNMVRLLQFLYQF